MVVRLSVGYFHDYVTKLFIKHSRTKNFYFESVFCFIAISTVLLNESEKAIVGFDDLDRNSYGTEHGFEIKTLSSWMFDEWFGNVISKIPNW